ncbi:MAG TPA: YceI family protein [Gemmatimonadales bacterium]|nr:YceI family protein [Gemmatimonadales bacterium]
MINCWMTRMEDFRVTIIRAVLLVLLAVAWAPLAAQAPAERTIPSGSVREGTLSFDGRATAGDFTGTTTSVTGEMTGGGLADVRGWVEAPVRTLATGNQRRDRDLNKSMESGKYPTIRFELTNVAAPEATSDSVNVVLHGRFIIHGVTREATIPASLVFRPEGIRVRGETPLNLKDYKIGGLSKALGMLKMHEKIVVHVDLMFGAKPLQQAGR